MLVLVRYLLSTMWLCPGISYVVSFDRKKIKCWDFLKTFFPRSSFPFFPPDVFLHSLMPIPIVSLQDFRNICESCWLFLILRWWWLFSHWKLKLARNAQEESTVLNRPIKIVVGCVDPMSSYVSWDVHVSLHRRLQSGVQRCLRLRRRLWHRCLTETYTGCKQRNPGCSLQSPVPAHPG